MSKPTPPVMANNPQEMAEWYISNRYKFRYNSVLACVEISDQHAADTDYERMTDRHANSIVRDMKKAGLKVSRSMFDETVESDFAEDYDPFTHYFDGLPPHDGKDYIAELAGTITLEDQSQKEVFATMLKKWMVATYACATQHGHINETGLFFIGEQGDGKTRWFRRLIPEALEHYQYTGLIRTDDTDSKVRLAECFIINLDELATLRKNDIESLKSLFSESTINTRRKYARRSEVLQRRASFVGSDNNEQILKDDTGSRRFLIFKIKYCDYLHKVDVNRAWGQAMHLFKQGAQYWLTQEEIKEVNDRNEQYQIGTAEEQLIRFHVKTGIDFYTTTDILRSINQAEANMEGHVSLKADQGTLTRIGSAMKKLGYIRTQKKVNGKPCYGYNCHIEIPARDPSGSQSPHEIAPF